METGIFSVVVVEKSNSFLFSFFFWKLPCCVAQLNKSLLLHEQPAQKMS
jgi:hypothetical protein